MASETPDPSSSELLTDFDIADVDNWDDQNDTSKDMELVKNTDAYVPSTSIHTLQSPIQGHLPGQQMPMKAGLQSGISSLDHLKPFQSLLLQRPSLQNQSSITSQQQAVGHEYARIHNHPQKMLDNTKQSPTISGKEAQGTEPAQQKTIQSGQALETLRALALAQEEQARKVKQDQEKAFQLQQQLKLVTSTPQLGDAANSRSITSPAAAILGMQQPSAAAKPSQLPITTLKLPITDPKGQSGKPNSVLQLRGQLVRTPDQKLMLVTELAGKKVGYLIGSQSGQLQATNAAVASQLIAKANQGIGQVQQKSKQVTAISVPSAISPIQNSVSDTEEKTIAEEPKQILDTVDENSNDSSRQTFAKEGSVTVSSDDDSGSLADVSLGLKNTTLDGAVSSDQKKRKVKGKKKKDKNEPAKPISPYLMFFKDAQPSVRQQNPGTTLGEASKMVAKLWEQLGKEEKQVYLDQSAKAKEEYQVKLAEYRASIAMSAASPVDRSSIPDDTSGSSPSNAIALDIDASPRKCDNEIIADDTSRRDTIVVSSSDSSPEESLKNRLENSSTTDSPAIGTEQETPMDVDAAPSDRSLTEDFHTDISSPVEEPIVRKRGRPKLSKNKKPPLRLPKTRRGKKVERIEKVEKVETPETEKPLKLTMKINIKDSKITESPTRAFAEVENSMVSEKLQNDNEDEEMEEKEVDEVKTSTQPKALLGFKIPKKQRPSTEDVKKETSDRLSKPSQPGFRKCSRPNCEKAAKINKERGPSYCSNKCLVLHCRNVFDTWVDERKRSLNKE